jgi:hypothetical protein
VEAIDGLVNGNGVLSCLKVTSEKQWALYQRL